MQNPQTFGRTFLAGLLVGVLVLAATGFGGTVGMVQVVRESVAAQYDAEGLTRRYLAGIRDGEVDSNTATATVGTTPVELTTTDATAAQSGKVMIYTVSNYHASQYLCVDEMDFSDQGSTDCNTDCAGGGFTCDGTIATDGKHRVMPSSQRSLSFAGDRCVCVVGSAASTSFSAERVIR